MKKKLSALLILSMLVGMFTGMIPASAASAWLFQTASGKEIAVNGSLTMKKNEYQDFNLLRHGEEITVTDEKYQITWSSSDEDIIWINAKTGQARADKNKAMTTESAEAVITAAIKNKSTGALAYRKFNVVVGKKTPVVDRLEIRFKDGTNPDETLQIGKTYSLESLTLDADGNQLSFAQTKLYRTYFCDQAGIVMNGSKFTPTAAGEYTITAGAFKSKALSAAAKNADDAEYVAELSFIVEPDEPSFESIWQTTLNTVEITLNKPEYAKAIVDNNRLLRVSYQIGGNVYTTDFQSISLSPDDNETIRVTMLTDLTQGVEYSFAHTEYTDTVARVTGSGITPSYIELVSDEVEIEKEYTMQVKVYNKEGVDISSVVFYPCTFEAQNKDALEYAYQLSNNTLYFFKPNNIAVIRATMDLGYDDYGNKLGVLTSTGDFTSIPKIKPIYGECNGFAIDTTNASVPDLNYTTNNTICVGDDSRGLFLYARFPYTDTDRKTGLSYIEKGTDTVDQSAYTYKSSDTRKLLVNEITGRLYPLAKGSAYVYIIDKDKNTIGRALITIEGKRAMQSFELSNSTGLLAATGILTGEDYISLKLMPKDQLGDKVSASYSFSLVDPLAYSNKSLFSYSVDGDTLKIKEGMDLATVVTGDTVQRFVIKITARYDDKTLSKNFTISVKNTRKATGIEPKLILSTPVIDMKLDKSKLSDYESTIRVVSTDNSGYFVASEEIKWITNVAGASTVKNKYSVLILYKGVTADNLTISQSYNSKELIIKPITNAGGNTIDKADLGIYEIKLYKGNGERAQLMTTSYLELTDTTQPITVTQKTKTLANTNWDTIKAALSFRRGTTDISQFVEITDIDAVNVGTIYHIRQLKLRIKVKELSSDWISDQDYTEVTIDESSLQFTTLE